MANEELENRRMGVEPGETKQCENPGQGTQTIGAGAGMAGMPSRVEPADARSDSRWSCVRVPPRETGGLIDTPLTGIGSSPGGSEDLHGAGDKSVATNASGEKIIAGQDSIDMPDVARSP